MKENNNLHIGIDVGSTTVKLAILDEAHEVKFSVYRRHHADVRALRGTINGLHRAAVYVHSLYGLAGERRAGRADVVHQPLAVGGPGAGVGELVVARSKGNLFHGVLTGPI